MFRSRRRRSGLTIIELLAVIAIIIVLASIVLPAIMNARTSTPRSQCLNRIRQVGLGLIQFASTHNKFPASGYWDVGEDGRAAGTVGGSPIRMRLDLRRRTLGPTHRE